MVFLFVFGIPYDLAFVLLFPLMATSLPFGSLLFCSFEELSSPFVASVSCFFGWEVMPLLLAEIGSRIHGWILTTFGF
jgi:hypothetical protein